MVPFSRDKRFLGRIEILEEIESKLNNQNQVALAGLGGVGKSQIAIEFCYIFHDKNPAAHVFWVYAGNRTRFEQGYQEIARKLALPGWEDSKVDSVELVYTWLQDSMDEKWLMIVDNADDESMFFGKFGHGQALNRSSALARYLPKCSSGCTLMTTRDRRLGERLTGRERAIEVVPMDLDDAKHLLLSSMSYEDQQDSSEIDATKLIQELAYLPFAITQAAAFISENMLTISEYLDLLAMGDLELQNVLSEHLEDPRRDLETENSVIRTWKLSFDQLTERKPRAAEILSLMAVLDYQATPRSLLRDVSETETGFRTALGALQAFSLIAPGKPAEASFKMHRLVAVATQKWLDMQGTLSYWQQQALKKVAEAYPGRQTFHKWELVEALTPHAQLIFSFTFSKAMDFLQCARLLDFSTLYDLGKGRYKEAHEKASRSCEIRKGLLKSDDPLMLDSEQMLGETQLHIGELQKARNTLEGAIAGREKVLGKLNQDTLESISDLTITLLELDELDAAERSGLRAYEGRKAVLGERNPDTLVSLNIMSIVQCRKGDWEKSFATTREVLQERINILGENHPETLMTLNNMAVIYHKTGDLQTSRSLLERVILGEDKLFGPECADKQVSLTNLADVLQDLGWHEEAEDKYRRTLEIREKKYGQDHAATRISVEKLFKHLEGTKSSTAEVEILRSKFQDDRTAAREIRGSAGALLTSGLLFD